MYLLKILAHPGITQEQKTTCEKFKTMMLSLNLQSMRLNAGDSKITNDEEVCIVDNVHPLISGYFVNLKVSFFPLQQAVLTVGGKTTTFG